MTMARGETERLYIHLLDASREFSRGKNLDHREINWMKWPKNGRAKAYFIIYWFLIIISNKSIYK